MIDSDLARRIRLVAMDVDGVLTEGGIFLGSAGGQEMEFKRYDIQDGMGLHLLKMAGIRTAILTGRESESVRMRARELGIDDCHQDSRARKLPAFRELCSRRDLAPGEAAFIGDDLPDLGVLRVVGLPVAVGNAVAEVKAACAVHLSRSGGHGAVRELAELLLKARGEWNELVEQYVADRSAEPAPAGGR
ncbi:MAG TPA: HAD hydrolase family protein [Gemmatimonadaceae bacterium]|nr:HAD hydrolase family protein [Gemmatimonadaceae bacterium]